jgi:hypothetical protein
VIRGNYSDGGGGCVLPVPEWLTHHTTRLPSTVEIEPWYDAICSLWDDGALYRAVSTRARELASEHYSEAVSRKRHVDYFTSLAPGSRPLAA